MAQLIQVIASKPRICQNCYRIRYSTFKKQRAQLSTLRRSNTNNSGTVFQFPKFQVHFHTSSTEHPSTQTTVDRDELSKFTKLANQWWDEKGEYYALHSMNKLRIPLIRDALTNTTETDILPLKDKCILDVGSGGGILTEPLARLGAKMTGIDMVEENVQVAKTHLSDDPDIEGRVRYIYGAVEDLVLTEAGKFDAVVASEVVEHVSDIDMFISSCCKLLKPGGSLFITTLNKTYLSYGLAVFGAEQLLRVVPPGTHDWIKFVPPEDLQLYLEKNDMTVRLVHGMCFNPVINKWSWISNSSVNYAVHAVKATTSIHSKDVVEQTEY